jgi:small multidrug resistance family-3 protein
MSVEQEVPPFSANGNESTSDNDLDWTTRTVVQAVSIFLLSGLAEIGGGWLVWQVVRNDNTNNNNQQPKWWWAVLGSVILVAYGFLPTLQPIDSFGRIYAAYGGFFIVLSLLWGWGLDGDQPDRGDVVGSSIALVGVCVLLFWPRQ